MNQVVLRVLQVGGVVLFGIFIYVLRRLWLRFHGPPPQVHSIPMGLQLHEQPQGGGGGGGAGRGDGGNGAGRGDGGNGAGRGVGGGGAGRGDGGGGAGRGDGGNGAGRGVGGNGAGRGDDGSGAGRGDGGNGAGRGGRGSGAGRGGRGTGAGRGGRGNVAARGGDGIQVIQQVDPQQEADLGHRQHLPLLPDTPRTAQVKPIQDGTLPPVDELKETSSYDAAEEYAVSGKLNDKSAALYNLTVVLLKLLARKKPSDQQQGVSSEPLLNAAVYAAQ
nr:myosin heavy chain IB-like isoform X2 [Arachis hypogaea]XP_025667723.1 myosin heavy chain IB-like isoform X2 [Arachis hypogaea]